MRGTAEFRRRIMNFLSHLQYTEEQAKKLMDEFVNDKLNTILPALEGKVGTEADIALFTIIMLGQKDQVEKLEREAKARRSRYDTIEIPIGGEN